MRSDKKPFVRPEVKRLGTVAELTKENNILQFIDVPLGGPIIQAS